MTGETQLIDVDRAMKNANFKTNKAKLIEIIEGYRQRKYVEDVDILKRDYGNSDGLLDALCVQAKQGISATSL